MVTFMGMTAVDLDLPSMFAMMRLFLWVKKPWPLRGSLSVVVALLPPPLLGLAAPPPLPDLRPPREDALLVVAVSERDGLEVRSSFVLFRSDEDPSSAFWRRLYIRDSNMDIAAAGSRWVVQIAFEIFARNNGVLLLKYNIFVTLHLFECFFFYPTIKKSTSTDKRRYVENHYLSSF